MMYLEKDPAVLLVTVFMVLVLILITHNWCMLHSNICQHFQRQSYQSHFSPKPLLGQQYFVFWVFLFVCFFIITCRAFHCLLLHLNLVKVRWHFCTCRITNPVLGLKKNYFHKKSIKTKHFMSWVVFAEEFTYEAGSINRAFHMENLFSEASYSPHHQL